MDITELGKRIRPLAEAEGLDLVVLFGSAARGQGAAEDLDLAVRGRKALDLVALTNRLTTTLSTQDVDVADLRIADPVLLLSVAEEGVPLYEAEPGTFARFQSLAARRFFDTRKFRDMERLEIRDFLARGRRAGAT